MVKFYLCDVIITYDRNISHNKWKINRKVINISYDMKCQLLKEIDKYQFKKEKRFIRVFMYLIVK